MTTTPPSPDIVARIRNRVVDGLTRLTPPLRIWAEAHIAAPRLITLFTALDASATEQYWLVTDDIGSEDGSYRVIYAEDLDCFGLAVRLQSGRGCCYGFFGSFDETVQNM